MGCTGSILRLCPRWGIEAHEILILGPIQFWDDMTDVCGNRYMHVPHPWQGVLNLIHGDYPRRNQPDIQQALKPGMIHLPDVLQHLGESYHHVALVRRVDAGYEHQLVAGKEGDGG